MAQQRINLKRHHFNHLVPRKALIIHILQIRNQDSRSRLFQLQMLIRILQRQQFHKRVTIPLHHSLSQILQILVKHLLLRRHLQLLFTISQLLPIR